MHNRFAPLDKSRRRPPPHKAAVQQKQLCAKHNYTYQVEDGKVMNNSTIYAITSVAHMHQIEELLDDAIQQAKAMPEVFGEDFACDYKINLVRKHTGEYLGYAYIDLSNPKLYYALVGKNVDGSDRVEYIDDPNWVPQALVPSVGKPISWADETDDLERPKIRKGLPPILCLKKYAFDEEQKRHLETQDTHGTITLLRCYITDEEDYDSTSLYVSDVPEEDYDFLYYIFARYARTRCYDKYYPQITIHTYSKKHQTLKNSKYYAIVKYLHHYDAAFARLMCQKIRARYKDRDVEMHVRFAS